MGNASKRVLGKFLNRGDWLYQIFFFANESALAPRISADGGPASDAHDQINYVVSRIPNMPNDNVELLRLGHRIQAERKVLGFSQNAFAKDCGLNRSFFGGIERGERNLTFAILCKICNGLHCDIANVTKGIPADVLRSPP